MEYKVNILREFYSNDDFHIYSGIINGDFSETSFKTRGFSLSSDSGIKTIVGDEGFYNGKKTIDVRYEKTNYQDIDVQRSILSNIRGVGITNLENILEGLDNNIFNVQNFEFIENLKIKGFGKKTLPKLLEDIKLTIDNLNDNILFNELQVLLSEKLKPGKIRELSKCIGMTSVGSLYEYPYRLLIEELEIGFKKADDIALTLLNIDKNNEERLKYLIAYILGKAINGNTYMELPTFIDEVKKNNIDNPLDKIVNNELIVIEDDRCYPFDLHKAETAIPEILNIFIQKNTYILFDEDVLKKYIKEAEVSFDIKYDNSQIESIINVVNDNVSCLVGNAGSGKSTTLKAIIFVLRKLRYRVRCLAPTGKASRRLEEATDNPASTIHSYIYSIDSNLRGKGSCSDDDVLIIDEFSMCDLLILFRLLSLCDELDYKKIIFVGDDGQLPSVQPGNNLFDIIQSGVINIARLNKIHRQGKDSNIIECAYKIRENESIPIVREKDFFFQSCYSKEDFYIQIDKMWIHLRSKYDDYSSFLNNVQFISPIKKGEAGCDAINKYIQNKYNDNPLHKYLNFKVNDKVMNIKNNRDKDIFNGECGVIKEISKDTFIVYFNSLGREIPFKFEDKNNFILAYCCTVHKLQGSEYKYIVLIIESDSMFLDSKILYTGITRGKETVIILSNIDTFNRIAKRNNTYKRFTRLQERLINTIEVPKYKEVPKVPNLFE
jgi:exodeoxyribonuclease V alpha subunit